MRRLFPRGASLLAVVALTLAACGGQDETPGDPAAAPDEEGSADAPEETGTDLEDHFSQAMEITVGFSAGGGYDLAARALAQHLGDHLPGSPRIQVSNITGADGTNSLRHMLDQPADGLTLAIFEGNALGYREFLGEDFGGMDIREDVEILGTTVDFLRDTHMYCVRSDVGRSYEEMIATAEERGRPITFAAQVNRPEVSFINSLDIPVEVVTGYEGGAATLQATDSGEVDGSFWCHPGSVENAVPHWLEEDVVTPVFAFADNQNDEFFESTGWERPPLFDEVVDLTEEQQELYAAIQQEFYGAFPYTIGVPSETPQDIKDALVEALEATANDPAFIETFEATANRFVTWRSGDEFEREFEILTSFPQEVHDQMAEFVVVN